MSNSHEVVGEQMARVRELPCTYCHGVRLVGWSGAGPLLCPECSRGQDAFTVVTQAWREQRTKVAELSALAEKMAADYSAARVGIMALQGELHEHLALMVRYLHEETSSGDGIAECHVDGYEAAKSLLVRSAPNQPSWENAQIEVADLLEADERLRAVRRLLEWNGCECECEHHWEDHDDDCDRCLACRIGEAVGK